jgi:hypothetical protein
MGNQRIGIIGNFSWRYSAEQDWRIAFQDEGYRTEILNERTASVSNVLDLAERVDVLLWISSCFRFGHDVMEQANKLTTTVGWHADLFFGLSRVGWKSMPMWSAQHILTADGGNDDKWQKLGINHHWMLPATRKKWTQTTGRTIRRMVCDVAFVGNNGLSYHKSWPYRVELNLELQKMCQRNGWTFMNPGGMQRRIERNQAMNDFYRSAKVTIGDSLCFDKENARYWSDRVYEATGRNGLLVMPQINALQDDFGDSLLMYPWGDWETLERMIADLLADEQRRNELRAAGRAHTSRHHTYNNRVHELLEIVT